MTFAQPPVPGSVVLALSLWFLDHDTLAALPGLPPWATQVDLTECEWVLQDHEYSQLAQRIPDSCAVLVLGSVPPARLQSICAGANAHRVGLGLDPLELIVSEYRGREEEIGEHVIVRGP